jgi:uncharacterized protein YyaL (SSP411 family)
VSRRASEKEDLCLNVAAARVDATQIYKPPRDLHSSARAAACLILTLAGLAATGSESPLVQAPSPYLQERARDLIAWRAWDAAALDEARRQGRPVLLVIGDPACAECRVAERQAFSDPEAAHLVNASFVGAVVDRFDRPDLLALFAPLLRVPGDARGRALAVFLLPDGRPFAAHAGIAPDERGASPGLRTLALRRLSDFQHDRAGMEAEAGLDLTWLARAQASEPPRGPLARDVVDRALKGLAESFDRETGGFGPGGEVPPGAPRLLLEEHARRADPALLGAASAALDRLAAAQRDSTVHVLARDAVLLRDLAQAYATGGSLGHRAAADALAGRVLATMRDAGGGFAAMGPGLSGDDRVIAGWNGLMIGALATSGAVLQRPSDLEAAVDVAVRVKERLGPAEALRHSVRGTTAGGSALLEDYAYLADGLLDLREATGDVRWQTEAAALAEAAVGRFADPAGGGFFATDAAHEPFPVRLKAAFDGPLPSANGVMARVLLRLGRATGQARYRDLARATIEAFLGNLQRAPRGMETLVGAAAALLAGETFPAAPSARLSRQTVGPVSLQASLSAARVRPDEAFEGRLRLEVADGWRVVAREPGVKDLFGLSVSVVGERLSTDGPIYPPALEEPGPWSTGAVRVHAGRAAVRVPLRVKPRTPPGELAVGLRVVFQPCDATGCKPPMTAHLEVPVMVDPAP